MSFSQLHVLKLLAVKFQILIIVFLFILYFYMHLEFLVAYLGKNHYQ